MTDVYVLRIDPDGTVTDAGKSADEAAKAEYGDLLTVVTLHHQMASRDTIGWIHDFGAVIPLELNRKAWALYGGSPVYGTMWMADDNKEPLDEDLVEMLTGEDDWIGSDMNRIMDNYLIRGPG